MVENEPKTGSFNVITLEIQYNVYQLSLFTDIRFQASVKMLDSVRNTGEILLTMPLVVLTQFILILEINFALGLSSGYRCPHSIFRLYILFS
jgi:hypothetical protein